MKLQPPVLLAHMKLLSKSRKRDKELVSVKRKEGKKGKKGEREGKLAG